MEAYYRERATVYDEFYQVGRRKDDLVALGSWLVERARGGMILEVAAGTGYWTEVAAPVAKAITATDYNPETLAIAAQRRLGSHVTLTVADAYRLPKLPGTFDMGMAMLWWSHVQKQRRREFLRHFTSRLAPGALVLMLDQFYIDGVSSPISRKDEWDNFYTVRTLSNGAKYEIIKNYPSDEELIDTFSDVCDDIVVTRLREFWTISARVRR
ncbi:class I SAM-dependent methyltransferase [Bradyrhizobium archetypum]|jgi:ubiquinone/menaquinone biosynthesis C-methylase UbiE|uniref:Class I SAM-dependent methyltransferase n=1 Tax=Bradyrhizobium archetypum TaxID=2721160 RepID=A0A7Y4HA49_9BRAD|nr:class I SAM-dependent methyltransferase [Bradyrhizobium archetypum]NOJ50478.1 class I SAM-dependent methyltransferase [Bradyrhizobium archetypum]